MSITACLVVEKVDSGYRAQWIQNEHGDPPSFALELPLAAAEAAELRWYLEKFHQFVGAGTRARAAAVERAIAGWSRELFRAIFGSAENPVYRRLRDATRAGQPASLTVASGDSAFLQQPWELMCDGVEPLVLQGISLRRQLADHTEATRHAAPFDLPIRLLLVVARPHGTSFLDPRSSVAPLFDALAALPEGLVEISLCEPPTLDRMQEQLASARRAGRPFHLLHFDGHGVFRPEAGIGALCFETADRRVDLVTGRRLGNLLAEHRIPAVLLEACQTSDLAERPPIWSVAPALLASGVGSVIAFSHAVHVEASRLLVTSFYRQLAAGRTLGQALAEARCQLRSQPQRWLHLGPNPATVALVDWFLPQLYQVGSDPVLFERRSADAAPAAAKRPERALHFFPAAPTHGFQGRAHELLELGRLLEASPAVLLTAGGGMGKTALAREAAWWWLRTGLFEAAVFISFEQVVTVERAARDLVQALGPPAPDAASCERAALALFRDKRILWVWDNFESSPEPLSVEGSRLRQFLADLTAGPSRGRVLITSRSPDPGLSGIAVFPLAGLARPDSLHLLQAIARSRSIDLERPGCEPEEIAQLLDLLDDHPLSISLVAPHLASLDPAWIRERFVALLDRFTDEAATEERNRSLLASLAFSISQLNAPARALLPCLAHFRGGACSSAIEGLAKSSPEEWPAIRDELERAALVRAEPMLSQAGPYLRFHPTLPHGLQRLHPAGTRSTRWISSPFTVVWRWPSTGCSKGTTWLPGKSWRRKKKRISGRRSRWPSATGKKCSVGRWPIRWAPS